MKQPCARAAVSHGKALLALVAALFALLLGGFLLRLPGVATKLMGLFTILVGASLFIDALEKMRAPEVVVESGRVLWGAEAIPLASLRAVRLGRRRAPGNLWAWSPALELDLPAGRRLLPLDRSGWWEVWDRLRELRPDLDLPDWRNDPQLINLLERRKVRQPPGTRFYGDEAGARVALGLVLLMFIFAALLALEALLHLQIAYETPLVLAAGLSSLASNALLRRRIESVPPPPPPCQAP